MRSSPNVTSARCVRPSCRTSGGSSRTITRTCISLTNNARSGRFVIDPTAPAWPDELATQIRLDAEPYTSWLAPFDRAVDVDVTHADPTGWEALHAHVAASGVKRICNAPLATPHRVLGILSLGRLTPMPFTSEELGWVAQIAEQIALALENALAFREIASLKDRLARENIYLEEEIRGAQHFGEIVGESRALKRILSQVATVAATDATVLLLGETGTGKELIARAIHAAGERRGRSLVTVNCATSPAGLLESEWFGHERGAFTGALSQKIGRFELAHQGTLFLDEIGDVPLELQSKLLRALQEREIERLGSTRTIRVDFRLIAATNRDLEEMVARREFRVGPVLPAEGVSTSEFRRCENVARTFRCSSATSRSGSPSGCGGPSIRSRARAWRCSAAGRGPATSASCRT